MPRECSGPNCHAEIDDAYSVPAEGEEEKRHPVNHDSADDPKGNLIVWRDDHGVLRFRYKRKGDSPGPGEHLGISHYATCPDADYFRSQRRRR